MNSESATAPTPFHIWVAPYERGGRHIRGHWRPRSGQADEARTWLEERDVSAPIAQTPIPPLDLDTKTVPKEDAPRPMPQRGGQIPTMGSSLASDEPPIGEILARLGVDRSEGRRWRRAGKHPALRWHRRYEDELAGEGELAGV